MRYGNNSENMQKLVESKETELDLRGPDLSLQLTHWGGGKGKEVVCTNCSLKPLVVTSID